MKISGTYSIYKNITLLRGRSFQLLSQYLNILSSKLSVRRFEAKAKTAGSFGCIRCVRNIDSLLKAIAFSSAKHYVVKFLLFKQESFRATDSASVSLPCHTSSFFSHLSMKCRMNLQTKYVLSHRLIK